jgi:hypothetical protein
MTLFIAVSCFVVGMAVGHWFKNRRSRYLARELEKAIFFADSMKKKNEDLAKELGRMERVVRKNEIDEMRIGLHEAALAMQMEGGL